MGFACSRLSSLGNGRVVFRSPQLPFAQGGFSLGRDLRVLGVVDAELRPLPHHDGPVAQFAVSAAQSGERLPRNDQEMNFKQLLRRSRAPLGPLLPGSVEDFALDCARAWRLAVLHRRKHALGL